MPCLLSARVDRRQTARSPPRQTGAVDRRTAEIAADPANRWTLELSSGQVVVRYAPTLRRSRLRIQQLTSQGFYNGLNFHRVIPGFMAQGGDPKGTGLGGSPLPDLNPEFNDLPHFRGVASMARAEAPNSANSQFFIMLAPRFSLDHKYSAFGRVIEGMAAIDGVAVGEPPAQPTRIVRATIGGPLPAPPAIAAVPVAAAPTVAAAPVAAPVATPARPEGPASEAPQRNNERRPIRLRPAADRIAFARAPARCGGLLWSRAIDVRPGGARLPIAAPGDILIFNDTA